MTPEEFKEAVAKLGIELSEQQMDQFARYYQLLVEWNQKMNLTAITDEKEVYLKHFYDSLTLLLADCNWQEINTVCDVGAGAGFPTIPLKIALPHLQLTIVDSLNKRIQFLQHLVDALELTDVVCHHDRAETFGKRDEMRESFDVVTARAVAPLNILSELCVPLVKVGGVFIALKAANGREELQQAKHALEVLGVTKMSTQDLVLPVSGDQRELFTLTKGVATPAKYPRRPGMPNKKPL